MPTWTPAQRDELERLWPTNSASEIASLPMFYRSGFTRNAVIGQVHRMSLPMKNSSYSPDSQRQKLIKAQRKTDRDNESRRKRREAEKPTTPMPPSNQPIESIGVPFMERNFYTECGWIIGTGADNLALYCGNPICDEHPSYCESHRGLACIGLRFTREKNYERPRDNSKSFRI